MPQAATDVKKNIRMTSDRLLVRSAEQEGERKTRGGILIPATAEVSRRLEWAEVVSIGPAVRNILEGDSVLFAPEKAFEVEIQGDLYSILQEQDVHAIASASVEAETGLYL